MAGGSNDPAESGAAVDRKAKVSRAAAVQWRGSRRYWDVSEAIGSAGRACIPKKAVGTVPGLSEVRSRRPRRGYETPLDFYSAGSSSWTRPGKSRRGSKYGRGTDCRRCRRQRSWCGVETLDGGGEQGRTRAKRRGRAETEVVALSKMDILAGGMGREMRSKKERQVVQYLGRGLTISVFLLTVEKTGECGMNARRHAIVGPLR